MPIQLTLDSSFPADVRSELNAVAQDVLSVITARLGNNLPAGDRPVVVSLRSKGPHVYPTKTEYQIHLTVDDRRFDQFGFQLAHELGHVLMDPRRSNGVLEGLATAISLQALADLSNKWAHQPPYPNWQSYAPNFQTNRSNNVREQLKTFPDDIVNAVNSGDWGKVTAYIMSRKADLDANLYDRPLNTLAALRLLEAGIPWPEINGLASKTDPSPITPDEFRTDLQLNMQKVSQPVRALLSCIGR